MEPLDWKRISDIQSNMEEHLNKLKTAISIESEMLCATEATDLFVLSEQILKDIRKITPFK